MSCNVNNNILLVGTGYMAGEYYKVLNALNISPDVIARSPEGAAKFRDNTGLRVIHGGCDAALPQINNIPGYAVIAVSAWNLAEVTIKLLNFGVKNILVEKPSGLSLQEIQEVNALSQEKGANVYVAYNRRFYASTDKALEIINQDGGVLSFNFEFTEWLDRINSNVNNPAVKKELLLCNSSHVIDLAFFLGGEPEKISSFTAGKDLISWHEHCSIYSGAGVTNKGALFTYSANWGSPGRWAVEVITRNHRLYFKPLEQLAVQENGSVEISRVNIDDHLDIQYKPGLYNEVRAFLYGEKKERLLTIQEQSEHVKIYNLMECR